MTENNIVIFDGVCNLCNWSVRFIIERDSRSVFKFASVQSAIGEKLLREYAIPFTEPKSVILLKNGQIHEKSSAALEIAAELDGFWRVLVILRLIPRPVRDFIYNWIARNRYRWFGKREVCMVPTTDQKARFL